MELLIREVEGLELESKVVAINRVTKVVKGGRNFRFSALVVVGDRNGHVGVGVGKALEVPEAIRKGEQDARKHIIKIPLRNGTITHETLHNCRFHLLQCPIPYQSASIYPHIGRALKPLISRHPANPYP